MSTKKHCRREETHPEAPKSESEAQIQAPGGPQWPKRLARGGGKTLDLPHIYPTNPYIAPVFGPPWREDYRREVN